MRERSDGCEKRLRSEAVAFIDNSHTHAHCSSVAASRAAQAASYCRVAWPTAAQTAIFKNSIFTEACCLHGINIFVGDLVSTVSDLVDERLHGSLESAIVEGCFAR